MEVVVVDMVAVVAVAARHLHHPHQQVGVAEVRRALLPVEAQLRHPLEVALPRDGRGDELLDDVARVHL